MSTKFWRSSLLASDSRETFAFHEAGHAIAAVLKNCETFAYLMDHPLMDGTNGVCVYFGNLSYEEDLLVSLAGPEAEYMVSGKRNGSYGDYAITDELINTRYSKIKGYNAKRLRARGCRSRFDMEHRDFTRTYAKIEQLLIDYRDAIEEVAYRLLITGWCHHRDICVAMGYNLVWDDDQTQSA